jgi:hypothetical protein
MKKNHLKAFLSAHAVCLCMLAFQGNVHGGPVWPGFDFYAVGNECYLKNMAGNIVHKWTSANMVMSHAHLLRDSSVLFPYADTNAFLSGVAVPGGGIQIIKWNGTVAWDYKYYSSMFIPHHDVEPVYHTNDISETPSLFVICATKENTNGVLAEKIVELKPSGAKDAVIKWVWYAYDHSTSSGTDKPELLDLNMGYGDGSGEQMTDWLHMNSVSYNPNLDQLVVGVNWFGEFIVLDHGTTTAQAAGHTGGNYGKGGDILYRWGNPLSYGCTGTRYLYRPHDANWVPKYMPGTRKPLPGAGNVLVISNKTLKGYEIATSGAAGAYKRIAGSAYGPESPYSSFDITRMSSDQGSIQRLPNGNTLLAKGSGATGILEFDAKGTVVEETPWSAQEYFRYDSSYLGSTLLDVDVPSDVAPVKPAPAITTPLQVVAACTGKQIDFTITNGTGRSARFTLYSIDGKMIFEKILIGRTFSWNMHNQSPGLYVMKVSCGGSHLERRLMISDRGR